jgi:hypothetical protein
MGGGRHYSIDSSHQRECQPGGIEIKALFFVSAVGSWKHGGGKMLEHRLINKKNGRLEIWSG